MFCISIAYRALNRVDPDCGTSFAWVTRALGPGLGWVTGFAIFDSLALRRTFPDYFGRSRETLAPLTHEMEDFDA